MRKIIYSILNELYPTYSIGQHENECKSPYLVLKFDEQNKSTNNWLCGWQVFEVMVYVPDSSVLPMDSILEQVKVSLAENNIEPTGNITPDFRDTTVHAYMRSIQFRIPKEL